MSTNIFGENEQSFTPDLKVLFEGSVGDIKTRGLENDISF